MYFRSDIVIESPIEKVYRVAETYPTFVRFYDIKNIIENNEDTIIVNVSYKLFGVRVSWSGIGKKIKHQAINYTQTEGLLKGMKANWSFMPFGDKTQVIIDINAEKRICFLDWFIKGRIKKIINGILTDLKKTAEKG